MSEREPPAQPTADQDEPEHPVKEAVEAAEQEAELPADETDEG